MEGDDLHFCEVRKREFNFTWENFSLSLDYIEELKGLTQKERYDYLYGTWSNTDVKIT